MNVYPPVNLALTRQLERAEATANAAFVDARALVSPESGATWIEVAGVRAMFDTPESPITQTFCLGMFQAPTSDDLAALEAFYAERSAPVYHEVSPLADPAVVPLLNERGYRVVPSSGNRDP